MIKTIIAAVAKNHAIGQNNDLPWSLPDDFRFFKDMTKGHHIIMGRKTFESLKTPLPNRTSIVITRDSAYRIPEGHYVVSTLEEAIAIGEGIGLAEIMIIGGGQIYKESLEKGLVDQMYITEVDADITDADTFFPEFDTNGWKEVSRIHHRTDERHAFPFDFVTYQRN